MTFVDTNILIDVLTGDPQWAHWSSGRLEEQTMDGGASVNPIVIAELSANYARLPDLLDVLAGLSIVITSFDEEAAFLAGTTFARYRREGVRSGARKVLPDFMIGAHAVVLGMPLLTRDPKLYRRYFPELILITPETDNG